MGDDDGDAATGDDNQDDNKAMTMTIDGRWQR